MRKAMIFAASAALLAACNTAPKTHFVINGEVGEKATEATEVALRNAKTGDTLAVCPITDGSFTFEGETDTVCVAMFMIDREHRAQVYIEPGQIAVDLSEMTAVGTPLNDANAAFNAATAALSDDATEEEYAAVLKEHYKLNETNALGENIWGNMMYYITYDEMTEFLATASDAVKNNPRNERMLKAKKAEQNTAPGKQFVDFPAKTVDIKNPANDGKDTTLGAIVAQGKPVLVDFWASWCGPCKNEINKYLSVYAPEYKDKVNFVGVAVWEDSVDDTKKGMNELPISWPVIFGGGRGDESPTNHYGIMGIPHIMLIGADGTIIARNLRGEAIKKAIDEVLTK